MALNQGEPASVQCTILGGDLPINVTWLLNGRTIDSFHDISLTRLGKRVNVLTVESVAAHHSGNYSCHATNQAGTTKYTAQLIVDGLFMEEKEDTHFNLFVLFSIYFINLFSSTKNKSFFLW